MIFFFQAARHPDATTVVTGIVGCAGLKVTQIMLFHSIFTTILFCIPYLQDEARYSLLWSSTCMFLHVLFVLTINY